MNMKQLNAYNYIWGRGWHCKYLHKQLSAADSHYRQERRGWENTNGCPVSARVKYSPVEFVFTFIPILWEHFFFDTCGKKFSLRRNLSEWRLTGRSGGKGEASDRLCPSDCTSVAVWQTAVPVGSSRQIASLCFSHCPLLSIRSHLLSSAWVTHLDGSEHPVIADSQQAGDEQKVSRLQLQMWEVWNVTCCSLEELHTHNGRRGCASWNELMTKTGWGEPVWRLMEWDVRVSSVCWWESCWFFLLEVFGDSWSSTNARRSGNVKQVQCC